MKKLLIINSLAFLSVLLFSCASRKDSNTSDVGTPATTAQNPVTDVASIQKITFNSATRGYSKTVVFTPDSVLILVHSMRGNEDVKKTMNVKEWSQLTTSLFEVRLEEIPKLARPSSESATDAALGSSITIFTSDKKQYAHYFDNTNPNEKLKKLMDAILALEKIKFLQ
ncbi:MAG: hypothetical protein JWP12_2920 [Bacteroidetes bacterium]|nr:hypothetical protein [Bacteroidota bacterium]